MHHPHSRYCNTLPRLIQKIDRFYNKYGISSPDNQKKINLNFESEWAHHNIKIKKLKGIFDGYHGNDWRSYIQYGQPYELQLIPHIPLYLIGLNRDAVYPINQPSIIKILEDTYVGYRTFVLLSDINNDITNDDDNNKKIQYSTNNINHKCSIRSKEYTSFLLLHLDQSKENKK